jgi:uncharacterized protein YndB with AHSA1/START domain
LDLGLPAAPATLRLSRRLAAPREHVFHAWTDPELLTQWCAPEGYEVPALARELRVGGPYRIEMDHPDERVVLRGRYLVVDRPVRLEYTYGWEGSEMEAPEMVVMVDFHARGDATEVVITHGPFESDAVLSFHEWAWNSCLAQLAGLLSHR